MTVYSARELLLYTVCTGLKHYLCAVGGVNHAHHHFVRASWCAYCGGRVYCVRDFHTPWRKASYMPSDPLPVYPHLYEATNSEYTINIKLE